MKKLKLTMGEQVKEYLKGKDAAKGAVLGATMGTTAILSACGWDTQQNYGVGPGLTPMEVETPFEPVTPPQAPQQPLQQEEEENEFVRFARETGNQYLQECTETADPGPSVRYAMRAMFIDMCARDKIDNDERLSKYSDLITFGCTHCRDTEEINCEVVEVLAPPTTSVLR